jgi:hypothetical protein
LPSCPSRTLPTNFSDESKKWETELRGELAATDVVLLLLTPNYEGKPDDLVLQEAGAAWALEKTMIPVVTRRVVLKNLPIAIDPATVIEISGVSGPNEAKKFVEAFEESLLAARNA